MIFRVAIRIELTFYKLLAFGLGVSYAVQVFLTIGGAFKFIPLTGVTLPFISNGGSSILASFIMIGIVQSLYVISESDVAHERRLVAAGADLSEFAGYEDLAEEEYEAGAGDHPEEVFGQSHVVSDEYAYEYERDFDDLAEEDEDEEDEDVEDVDFSAAGLRRKHQIIKQDFYEIRDPDDDRDNPFR